jgi:hypothetical protein
MSRKRLPSLSDTGRRYLDGTQRARLASPGIERFGSPRGKGARLLGAALLAAALVAAMVWLS